MLFISLFAGCALQKYTTQYKKDYAYDEKELLIKDIYSYQWLLGVDSIPLQDWLVTQNETKDGYTIKRVLLLKTASSQRIFFIYTTDVRMDTMMYNLEIIDIKD